MSENWQWILKRTKHNTHNLYPNIPEFPFTRTSNLKIWFNTYLWQHNCILLFIWTNTSSIKCFWLFLFFIWYLTNIFIIINFLLLIWYLPSLFITINTPPFNLIILACHIKFIVLYHIILISHTINQA